MMKLDQRGWGLGNMIVFMCVFVLAIVVVAIQASKLGITGEKPSSTAIPTKAPIVTPTATPNPTATPAFSTPTPVPSATPGSLTHQELEKKAEAAAKQYKEKYYVSLQEGDSVTVTVQRLISENMLQKLVSENQAVCTGYVKFTAGKPDSYLAYLACGKTKTEGYSAEFDTEK